MIKFRVGRHLVFRDGAHLNFLRAFRRGEGKFRVSYGCGEIPSAEGNVQLRVALAMEGGDQLLQEMIVETDPDLRVRFLACQCQMLTLRVSRIRGTCATFDIANSARL